MKIIIGATGTGKTSYSLKQNLPIVNLDSRQVWRVKILTASPSEEEKKQQDHYLFNFLDDNEIFSVGKWVEEFIKLPKQDYCIVGGSIFYARCITRGLPLCKPSQETLQWYQSLENPYDYYLQYLKNHIEIFPADYKRLKRYVCFWREFGCIFSEYKDKFKISAHITGIFYKDINEHEQRLKKRLYQDWERILDEVKSIGWVENFTSIIGYKEIFEYLDGRISEQDALNKILIATRQYSVYQQKFLRQIQCDEKIFI